MRLLCYVIKVQSLKQIHGNSFEKKLSVLFGMRSEVSPHFFFNLRSDSYCFLSFFIHVIFNYLQGGPKSSGDGGPTQRASALAALSSALNPSSQGKQVLLIISFTIFLIC